MPEIRLTEQLFIQAKVRASAEGYKSVEAYIAELIEMDLASVVEDVDSLLTPARLAQIDRALSQIDAGEFRTSTQVREHFKKRFEE